MDAIAADVIGDVALVVAVSAVFGALARRLGQPAVVGQIIAGILLGPSVLGRLPGHLSGRLFPAPALPFLTVLSQVAIVVFMFVVGYEVDHRLLRTRYRAASLTAVVALLAPMALGSAAAIVFQRDFASFGQPPGRESFILFMGVALSITALPVLAAILRERGIAGTAPGVTATAAAGLMDVGAWLVLAVVLVTTGHRPGLPWPARLLLTAGLFVVTLLVVRPALRWWMGQRRSLLASPLPVALVLATGCAWATASLGLHPVFGAFLAGLIMPSLDGAPDPEVVRPMEQVGGLLLPLFFVVTGLSVNLAGLDGAAVATLTLVCVLAGAGKLGPAYLAARACGLPVREAATVAVLVNTRGLTELIALNIGLSAGIIDRRLFSILVLMALVMTVVTAPLLSLVRASAAPPSGRGPRPATAPPPGAAER